MFYVLIYGYFDSEDMYKYVILIKRSPGGSLKAKTYEKGKNSEIFLFLRTAAVQVI